MVNRRLLVVGLGLALTSIGAAAQTTSSIRSPSDPNETYSAEEIVAAGHMFFGKTTRGLGEAIESVFESQGRPTAYIVGEEGSGAFVGGLRYGEGTIYYKNGTRQKIYWQGPSLGIDFGADGARSLVLVYNSARPHDIYGKRFGGVEGSAYVVGGVGVNFQKYGDIILAPIRTGVGARLGANVGYLKYSKAPTWNPF
ncbi:MAG: DUF1134 domain-containing protein [Hyphomicrobiales bacterium]